MNEVNMSSVFDKCEKWSHTSSGKKALNAAMLNLSNNASFGSDLARETSLSKEDVHELAEKLKSLIISTASTFDLPQSINETIGTLSVGEVTELRGGFEVSLNFDDGALIRPSLERRVSPRSRALFTMVSTPFAYNIVGLFNHGYSARANVYGFWPTAGREVKSLRERAGKHFLEEAINQFNSAYSDKYNVEVILNDIY